MILQSLHDLYDRLASDPSYEIAKAGYSPQNISFRVVLKKDGSLFHIQDARIKDDKGKLRSEKQLVIGEGKPSGSGINPCFLWDNLSYMLGYKKDDPKPERTEKSYQAFRDKHLALEKEISLASYSSVCRFLEKWTPEQATKYAEKHPEIDELGTGFGIFQIQGETKAVNEDPKILTWWDTQTQASSSEDLGQCLITGKQQVAIARLHPKIKSVVGAQSSGASIVSFNASAYESYAKDQSFNAPVSESAAFKYTTALNSLLNGPKSSKHRIRIGDTTCVFWTDKPSLVEDVAHYFFSSGSSAAEESQDAATISKINTFLESLRKGSDVLADLDEDPQSTRFYILGLAPNAARLSVRFFYESSVAELLESLRCHHRDIGIIPEWDSDPEFPANWQLLRQSARVSDEIPPFLGGSLMRATLLNTRYPEGLYAAVMRRIRADRTVNYFRAAIIKGTLTRNHNQTIPTMLDTENTDPAYLLGRLFATLEKTQDDAHGDLNSGLRDRFYSSASATPASVFPLILRTYQHHLSKLDGGAKVNREKLVQEILDSIPATGFPAHLNMKSQGVFAIGYYHQRKSFFTKKEPAAETTES